MSVYCRIHSLLVILAPQIKISYVENDSVDYLEQQLSGVLLRLSISYSGVLGVLGVLRTRVGEPGTLSTVPQSIRDPVCPRTSYWIPEYSKYS
jgi:hypothetical protein